MMSVAGQQATQIWFALLAFTTTLRSVHQYEITTPGSAVVIATHETVTVECNVRTEVFNLFDHPVVWRKTQFHDDSQVNMMGNLVEPFVTAGRYKATLTQHPPNYLFALTISDVSVEDSGNYTCDVNGPQNSIIASVSHQISVRAGVDEIVITTANLSMSALQQRRAKTITYTENQPGLLRCAAQGGYPPADIRVSVGSRDVTDWFSASRRTWTSGLRGLRTIHHSLERWSDVFRVGADDDGVRVRCDVLVDGLTPSSSSVILSVLYAPIIVCDSNTAKIGEKNVRVRCEVRAKPEVTSLYWIIDRQGTTVAEGEVTSDYWTLVMVQDRAEVDLETQLFLREATVDSFRTYTLVAENSVGRTTGESTLTQKSVTTTSPSPDMDRAPSIRRSSNRASYLPVFSGSAPCCAFNIHLYLYSIAISIVTNNYNLNFIIFI